MKKPKARRRLNTWGRPPDENALKISRKKTPIAVDRIVWDTLGELGINRTEEINNHLADKLRQLQQ